MRRLLAVVALAGSVAAAACANRALQPPGAPVADKAPPRLVRVTPESGSVNQKPGRVQFVFDKVLNYSPARGEFDQYFLISPWDGVPRVNWHRTYIDVRPRHSFRANTAYTITLLPGLADVRGNAMKEGVTTVFSTGAAFPQFGITGTIFDWAAEKPANGALIEAISRPDSTVYLAIADSMGQYAIGPFNAGRYTLLGFIDRNGNRGIDPGEAWDSSTVVINKTRPLVELLAINKDTIPPRMASASKEDSTTIRVTFDRALDPGMPLTTALFRVQRADSTEIPIARVIGARAAQVADSIARRDTVRRDSTGRRDTTARRDTSASARRDTTVAARAGLPPSIVPIPITSPGPTQPGPRPPTPAAPPAPRPSRPAPETSVLLKLAPPASLQPGATYRLTARGIRNLMGRAGTSSRTITIPKPPPTPPRDTTRAKPDSTRTPPKRPPASVG